MHGNPDAFLPNTSSRVTETELSTEATRNYSVCHHFCYFTALSFCRSPAVSISFIYIQYYYSILIMVQNFFFFYLLKNLLWRSTNEGTSIEASCGWASMAQTFVLKPSRLTTLSQIKEQRIFSIKRREAHHPVITMDFSPRLGDWSGASTPSTITRGSDAAIKASTMCLLL